MPIIELSEQEMQDLLNGEELDKTFFAYDGNLTIRRLPVMEETEKCTVCNRPTKRIDWGFQSSICNDNGTSTNMVTCKYCVKKQLNTGNS